MWRSSLKSKAHRMGHQEVLLFYSQQKIVRQVRIIIIYLSFVLLFDVGQEAQVTLTLGDRVI